MTRSYDPTIANLTNTGEKESKAKDGKPQLRLAT